MTSDGMANKVAWVTGSSRGIGAGISRLFARHGARVALHGRDREALQAVQQEITASGGQAMSVEADITSFAEIERARAEIERAFGPIDVLIANAGGSVTPPGPIEEISEEGWHASVNANLTATFLTLKSVLPGMKQRQRGAIVTISSTAGHRPHPRSPIPYAAAKAGIEILTKDVSTQVGPFGIRINCIAPETIMTERSHQWISEEVQKQLIAIHPIRRLGTVDDVAQVALFLASDQATWLTGLVIDVAGGVTGYPAG
jgi:3-oxoacyl-[acyl-carrier protein] reductase